MIPNHFIPQYSESQIQARVAELGHDITTWADEVWNKSHTDIIAVPVLRGAIFFFADLVRRIERSVEIFPARTWAYVTGENGVERNKIKVNVEGIPAEGRSILLVDDICDSGRTLEELTRVFMQIGAKEVRSAALIRRKMEQKTFQPEYVGFDFEGNEWFVGYGMEDSERWRNLPGAYVIKQS